MKISKYVQVIKLENGGLLFFNALNGALLHVSAADHISLLDDGDVNKFPSHVIERLINAEIIIPDKLNEIEFLQKAFIARKESPYSLGLTITPYLGCNLNCDYCFVSKKNESISKDVVENIYNLIAKMNCINKLSISWMGGEPLIKADTICDMSSTITSLCKKNRIKYYSRILTNGILLTKDVAKSLSDVNIKQVQVSIDGSKFVQKKRRSVSGGIDTYKIVLDNIHHAVKYLEVGLRVNIDRMNGNDIDNLLSDLETLGLKRKVLINYGQLVSFEGTCTLVCDRCYTKKEFANVEIDLYKKTIEKGFIFANQQLPGAMFCGALAKNSFAIDPDGSVHKCWNFIGHFDKKIGTLTNKGISFEKNVNVWNNYDPHKNRSCIKCSVFPLCNGGCPYNVLILKHKQENNCQPVKWNLHKMLVMSYQAGGDAQVEK